MIKVLLISAYSLISLNISAQIILLDRASDLIQKKEYLKALETLQKAKDHPTTANDARTHYLMAFLFKELYQHSEFSEKREYMTKSMNSIMACRSIDLDKTYNTALRELELFFGATVFNKGSELFNAKKYLACIAEFENYLQLSHAESSYWSDANYYIGTSYYELNEYDSAQKRFEHLLSEKYDQPLLYLDLCSIYVNKNETSRADTLISEALHRYPNNYDLRIVQINLYSHMNRFVELESVIERFLQQNPETIEVMLVAGTVYERNSTEETKIIYKKKIETIYNRILALDTLNYDANYNLGVFYYNEAVDIVNKTDLDTDLDQLSRILEKSTALFEKALPYLERIFNYDQSNAKLLMALRAIYYNLNRKAELAKINSLIGTTEQQ